jgi:inner membrane protein
LWSVIVDAPDAYHLLTVDTWRNTVDQAPETGIVYRPETTLATLVAKRSYLGEIYLDWSQFPIVEQTGIDADGNATVTFRDLRFMYDTFLTRSLADSRNDPPLSGKVIVNADRRVVSMEMDGRKQK